MQSISGFFARNWTLKLSAFGVALLLWVSVRAEAPDRQTLPEVPIRLELSDPDWALVGGIEPATASVRFHGPSRELIRNLVDQPRIVIAVDQVHSADTTIVLQPGHVRTQDRPGIVVDDIQPLSVRLSFEPIRRVELPVAVRVTDELPDGFALASWPVPIPAMLQVSGPQSRVEPLDSVRLQPIDLSSVEGSGPIPVSVDTTGLARVLVQPARLQLALEVVEREERTFGNVPIVVGVPDWEDRYELSTAAATVRLTGAARLLDAVPPGSLYLLVDLEEGELPEEVGDEQPGSLMLQGVPRLLTGEFEVEEVTVRRRDPSGDLQ
ncbi:MAG: CdaR family protein [Gemmatimonadota bacterium]